MPAVLTIAGLDPSSGAGITADLKVFAAHNCYGLAVVTSLTVQTAAGVRDRTDVSAKLLVEQIDALAEDIPLASIKIGMLGSAANVEAVAAAIDRHKPPFVVLDPVMRSGNGTELLSRAGFEALRDRLLPRASVITPNLDEAGALTGMKVTSMDEARTAAAVLHRMSGASVVITGGHLEKPNDLFFDGNEYTVLAGERIRNDPTHGTGCAFSAAIAANLALGKGLADSLVRAKAYVSRAIEKGHVLGRGGVVLNHLYRLQAQPPARSVVTDAAAESHDAGHR